MPPAWRHDHLRLEQPTRITTLRISCKAKTAWATTKRFRAWRTNLLWYKRRVWLLSFRCGGAWTGSIHSKKKGNNSRLMPFTKTWHSIHTARLGRIFFRLDRTVSQPNQSDAVAWWPGAYRDKAERTYVAIKILSAHATLLIDAKLNPEIIVNELVSSADRSHPGYNYCLSSITSFRIKSIAGKHICLVLPLMNGSIIDLHPLTGTRFEVSTAKRIIKDVLRGLDYLHNCCGYVHTGTPFQSRCTWGS